MINKYREETKKEPYSTECCTNPSNSYSDEYVKWLELKTSELLASNNEKDSEIVKLKERVVFWNDLHSEAIEEKKQLKSK